MTKVTFPICVPYAIQRSECEKKSAFGQDIGCVICQQSSGMFSLGSARGSLCRYDFPHHCDLIWLQFHQNFFSSQLALQLVCSSCSLHMLWLPIMPHFLKAFGRILYQRQSYSHLIGSNISILHLCSISNKLCHCPVKPLIMLEKNSQTLELLVCGGIFRGFLTVPFLKQWAWITSNI